MIKKKDRSKIFFGVFIIFLMVSSTLGFIYGGGEETKKINGYKFVKTPVGWSTYIKDIESYWEFTYLPDEINFDLSYFDLNSEAVYLYDLNNQTDYLSKFKFIFLYGGVIAEPVEELDCASDTKTFVLDHSLSSSEIVVDENCIYLNGNLNKFIDGLTYKVFGVI
ncbi:hypothetical protein K8R33_02485 [archaeon]|nr:hypothetical protein [archaeon]